MKQSNQPNFASYLSRQDGLTPKSQKKYSQPEQKPYEGLLGRRNTRANQDVFPLLTLDHPQRQPRLYAGKDFCLAPEAPLIPGHRKNCEKHHRRVVRPEPTSPTLGTAQNPAQKILCEPRWIQLLPEAGRLARRNRPDPQTHAPRDSWLLE